MDAVLQAVATGVMDQLQGSWAGSGAHRPVARAQAVLHVLQAVTAGALDPGDAVDVNQLTLESLEQRLAALELATGGRGR